MKKALGRALRGLGTCAAVGLGAMAMAVGQPSPLDMSSGWTQYTPGPTEFRGRPLTPTCSGFPNTDPTFRFWAKPGQVNNLVVFFEGGGACWDAFTCANPIDSNRPPTAPQFYKPAISPGDDPRILNGLFDLANSRNPVKDWSLVYIPYCTGDVHLGSQDTTYTTTSGEFAIHHRGFDNFLVVLQWIQAHFTTPNKVLVAGSSAGAYGATGHFAWLAEAFPNAHMYLIADAGQGVTTPHWDTSVRNQSWNFQLPDWIFGTNPSPVPTREILKTVMTHYPHSKFAQYTTAWDGVQTAFFSVMQQFSGSGGTGTACADWNRQMLEGLAYSAGAGNFRRYLGAGTEHTILRSAKFFGENSAGIGYADWVAGMLQSQGGTNGQGGLPWANVSCTECQPPPVCPF